MKKVILFLLVITISLGGLAFAHASVTAIQDNLLIYPTVEQGDRSVLEDLTADMTFTCGEHLRWHTAYTFGGETDTEFIYDRKGTPAPNYHTDNQFSLGLPLGMSGSSTAGYPLRNTDYDRMIRQVAAETPAGGSATRQLLISEYMDYYLPDYFLSYADAGHISSEGFDLYSWIIHDDQASRGCYEALTTAFRFPVQPGNTVSITTKKDETGLLNGIEFYPENGPELRLVGGVNAEGICFVPIFRDEQGAPLPYESPAGHGIYFIPWAYVGTVRYTDGEKDVLTPDVSQARLLLPLDENLNILHMEILADTGKAWILTCNEESYTLSALDLASGRLLASLELLPREPETVPGGYFFTDEGYLLAVIDGQLSLVDTSTHSLLLTAPDTTDQAFGGHFYNESTGTIHFDGHTLILTDASHYRDGSFWAAAWQQGELVYYGEYDCSLMRGNDDWYYSHITAEAWPITLK